MDSPPADGRVLQFPGRPGRERWVTKRELAEYLQVSEKTIDRWAAAGMPRLAAPGRRTVRFRISACEAWLGAQ
jgi:excisionase family DNA binding protein